MQQLLASDVLADGRSECCFSVVSELGERGAPTHWLPRAGPNSGPEAYSVTFFDLDHCQTCCHDHVRIQIITSSSYPY